MLFKFNSGKLYITGISFVKMNYESLKDEKFVKFFKGIFNFLILLLIAGVLVIILRELYSLFSGILSSEINVMINNILFIFILIELFTILLSYLRFQHIKVERVIEVGIISVVRDSIFHVFESEPSKMYGISALLLVFGLIFFIEKKFSGKTNNDSED